MLLSDTDIRKAVDAGYIGIEPFDPSRLNPASYTLSLGSRLLIPKPGKPLNADKPDVVYEEVTIGTKGYVVQPGAFLLASVAERLTVSTHLAARLDARTSLARLGLNVLQGSTHIEPGQHDSHETLEINNIGPSPVRLRPGMKIVKVVFERLDTPASHGYAGKYAAQTTARPKS